MARGERQPGTSTRTIAIRCTSRTITNDQVVLNNFQVFVKSMNCIIVCFHCQLDIENEILRLTETFSLGS